jgi:hypothetical protein
VQRVLDLVGKVVGEPLNQRELVLADRDLIGDLFFCVHTHGRHFERRRDEALQEVSVATPTQPLKDGSNPGDRTPASEHDSGRVKRRNRE